jgi:hypothetical protein
VGRWQLVAVLVLAVAVAVGVAIAAASRGSGKPSKPAPSVLLRGVGDDDANLMRRLQRDQRARSQK